MGLSEEHLHADEDTLHHCPSVSTLLFYMEVEDEWYEEMSLFPCSKLLIGSAGETVIPACCRQSWVVIYGRWFHNSTWLYSCVKACVWLRYAVRSAYLSPTIKYRQGLCSSDVFLQWIIIDLVVLKSTRYKPNSLHPQLIKYVWVKCTAVMKPASSCFHVI